MENLALAAAMSPFACTGAVAPSLSTVTPSLSGTRSWTAVPMPDVDAVRTNGTRVSTYAVHGVIATRSIAAFATQGAPPRGEPR